MADKINIRIDDHTDDVRKELERRVGLALAAMGEIIEGYAKEECPVGTPESTGIEGYVGGRLRNSITYVTDTKQGGANSHSGAEAKSSDYKPHATPEEHTVYIGTNVEYAPYVELIDRYHHLTGRAHFLRDAAVNHGDELKTVTQEILES